MYLASAVRSNEIFLILSIDSLIETFELPIADIVSEFRIHGHLEDSWALHTFVCSSADPNAYVAVAYIGRRMIQPSMTLLPANNTTSKYIIVCSVDQ